MRFTGARFILVAGLLCAIACNPDSNNPPKPAEPAAAIPKPKAAEPNNTDVAKIVFVGQKDACECTRKRIDTTWANFQAALDKRKDITIESIQLDVETQQADKLDDLRSIIVPPGIYFFDANENLLEMLQGELTSEQISKAL